MRLTTVFLCFFLAAGLVQAAQPVEIYANGTRYDSMEAYKALKKSPQDDVASETKVPAALEGISLEQAIGRVMADFKQNWDDPTPKFTISTLELEDRIRALAADRKEPVLLISKPQKLTVAAYEDQDK